MSDEKLWYVLVLILEQNLFMLLMSLNGSVSGLCLNLRWSVFGAFGCLTFSFISISSEPILDNGNIFFISIHQEVSIEEVIDITFNKSWFKVGSNYHLKKIEKGP